MMPSYRLSQYASQQLNSIRIPSKAAVQVLITLLAFSLYLFPTIAAAQSPHIYDVPQAGPPGSQTQTVGNGFDANATLDIYFDSSHVGLVDTDSNGSFGMALRAPTIRQNGLTLQIPGDAVPGQHWITAVERITQLQAQVGFTVRSTTGWMQYQFDAQHTGFNPYETVLNQNNVQNLVQRWNYTVASGLWISPVLSNGKLYLAHDSLYALDAMTGSLLWEYPGPMYTDGGGAPTVANGLVYVCSREGIVALNADTGSWVWTSSLLGTYCMTMPTEANGVLYFSSSPNLGWSDVNALDASTGVLLWKNSSLAGVTGEPAVANGVVYVGSTDTNIYALDAHTGAILWQYKTLDWVATSPIVANGIVYVASSEGFPLYAVYALDAKTGTLIWKREAYWGFGVAAVANGIAYLVQADYNLYAGVLWAADAATGNLRWKHVFEGEAYASAVVANGVIYVSSANSLYALNPNWGGVLATYTTPSRVFSPTVDNGMVYLISNDGKLYAFGLPGQQMSEKFTPPERPDPALLMPDWSRKPNREVTPTLKK